LPHEEALVVTLDGFVGSPGLHDAGKENRLWCWHRCRHRPSHNFYLLKAADAPATDALRYPIGNARPWPTIWQFPNTLAAALLQAGERDAVVAFLEKYARITVSGRGRTLVDIALIRSGKLPDWAQAKPPRS